MLSNGTMRGGKWKYGGSSDPLTWGERLLRWAVTLILLAALGLCWFYLLGGSASAQQAPPRDVAGECHRLLGEAHHLQAILRDRIAALEAEVQRQQAELKKLQPKTEEKKSEK